MEDMDKILSIIGASIGVLLAINSFFLSRIYLKIATLEVRIAVNLTENKTTKEEIKKIRDRYHDLANHVARLDGRVHLLEKK